MSIPNRRYRPKHIFIGNVPIEIHATYLIYNIKFQTLLSVGGRNHNATDWTRMASTNSSIDSFIANSMKYIREHKFDGIDLDWHFPAFCESPDRCSPADDASRFKVLVEKFREAIDSENVPRENKFIISSSAGHKKNQILQTQSKSMEFPTTNSFTTRATSVKSNNITTTPFVAQKPDLKVKIWSPIVAVILFASIVVAIIFCFKRRKSNTTNDHQTKNQDNDVTVYEEYENYGSVNYDGNTTGITHEDSCYSQIYTEYDNVYAEYQEHYAEYKKSKKS